MTDLSVLLATHGRPDLLGETLESLSPSHRSGMIGKVVVVENGGDFGARAICEAFSGECLVEFVSVDMANKSHALNVGLDHCSEGLVFMTDDDVRIETSVIAAYRDFLAKHPKGCFFGGSTVGVHEEKIPAWMLDLMPRSVTGWEGSQEKIDGKSNFLGFNWAAHRADLIAAGGFNPDYGPGGLAGATGQESDMQRRLRANGVKGIYVENATVKHMVPRERSSKEWLLRRSFREGVEWGLQVKSGKEEEADAYWRNSLLRLRAKALLFGLVMSEEDRFRNRHRRQRFLGYKQGCDMRRSGRLSQAPFLPVGAS